MQTILWHDYETFGQDPRRDRPAQFAALRTDLDLNPVEDPLVLYCKPADDVLPAPVACLITGITPQEAQSKGLVEDQFIARIDEAFRVPETCGAGYNNIRFDDEVTRHTLYRNLYDPYAREWQNGNSRWDLLDVLRLAWALRPEGIVWPKGEDGKPSFRLELLTAANGIDHASAHDAMSDVEATLAMARLLKARQPRLYQWAFDHRSKHALRSLVDLQSRKPLLHVSGMYGTEKGCCALVAPLMWHPVNENGLIVWDLRESPAELVDMDAETLRYRLFSDRATLEEDGNTRLPIKVVHLNKSPILAPSGVVKGTDPARLAGFGLDGATLRTHLAQVREVADKVQDVLKAVFESPPESTDDDADVALYQGFWPDSDRKLMQEVHRQPPELLGELDVKFSDDRLKTLFFRFRARNYPETLNSEERERWERYRYTKLTDPDSRYLTFERYFAEIQRLMARPDCSARDREILENLIIYGQSILPAL
ncbi:exodeoxyribonuclease I [Hahella sp. SMD15-11]|uniref:Exodeoxyribonuclease I n=1 Tax=Thermohahella caldifontis TaxID=3142973 RepID=A0AB39UXH3_9GAMM